MNEKLGQIFAVAVVVLAIGIGQEALALTYVHGEVGTPAGSTNTYPSVAADASGAFYAAWCESTTGAIRLESWTGSAWTLETSFSPADVGGGSTSFGDGLSLAMDVNGDAHVVFQARFGAGVGSTRDLWYGFFDGSWSFSLIEQYFDVQGWRNLEDPELALDGSGTPHVVWILSDANTNTHDLRYWVLGGAVTTLRTVTGLGTDLAAPTLAVSAAGVAHVSFMQDDGLTPEENDLYYGTNAGGTWMYEEVVAGSDTVSPGEPSSIVLDGDGAIHLAWYEADGSALYYATNETGAFVPDLINSGVRDLGLRCTLRLNSSGLKILAYRDATLQNLKVAMHNGGCNWDRDTVYTTDDAGRYIGAQINDAGEIMVVHERKIGEFDKRVMYSTATLKPYMVGDLNGDDVVNAVDVQLMINEALDIDTGFSGDVNCDGQVTAADIQMAILAALGAL
jgi:dockerin type I repeat protein